VVRIENAGWICISDGRRISIEAKTPADLEMVSLFIPATALPIAALQVGKIPLHLAAVRVADGIQVFAGDSGAGKSTIVAALRSCGHTVLTDDMAVFSPSLTASAQHTDGRLHFGVNRIKLWKDAAGMLKQADSAVRQDYFRTQKLHFAIDSEPSISISEISSVIKLSWTEETTISRMSGSKKFELLMNAVYPRRMIHQLFELGRLRSEIVRLSSFGVGLHLTRPRNADVFSVLTTLNSASLTDQLADHPI